MAKPRYFRFYESNGSPFIALFEKRDGFGFVMASS